MSEFNWSDFPLLQTFMTAAMRANSAPPDFEFTSEPQVKDRLLLAEAEKELLDLQMCASGPDAVYQLGYLADAGYTTQVDDDGRVVKMRAYEVLEAEY